MYPYFNPIRKILQYNTILGKCTVFHRPRKDITILYQPSIFIQLLSKILIHPLAKSLVNKSKHAPPIAEPKTVTAAFRLNCSKQSTGSCKPFFFYIQSINNIDQKGLKIEKAGRES